jgi:hypothetical protein
MYLGPRRVFHRIVRAKCSGQVAGGNVHSLVWETREKGKRKKVKEKRVMVARGEKKKKKRQDKKKKKITCHSRVDGSELAAVLLAPLETHEHGLSEQSREKGLRVHKRRGLIFLGGGNQRVSSKKKKKNTKKERDSLAHQPFCRVFFFSFLFL